MATQQQSFVEKRRGDTWVNVLIGAVAAFAGSSFLPIGAQFLGAGVAGYLQDTTRTDGAKVGAIAAALSSIPGLAIAFLVFIPFVLLPLLGGDLAFGAISGVLLLVVVAIVVGGVLASAVVGAAGGYLGAMVAED